MTGIDLRKPALAALGAVVLACSVLAAGAQRTEDRIALAVRKPSLTTGVGNAEVTWITGPTNVVSYDYTVTCYTQDVTIPTDDCQAVESAGLVPLFVETGTLPRLYSEMAVEVTGLPTDSSTIDCFINIDGGPADKVSKCMPVPQDPFRIALNGVTVTCLDAEVGDTGELNGIEYTKRDRDGLLALVGSEATEAELATSCTTGVSSMAELFGYMEERSGNEFDFGFNWHSDAADPATFNPDISSWDMSSVTNMRAMLAGSLVFDRDVSAWDTAQVTDMSFVFAGAHNFDQSLDGYGWDTSSVTDTVGMFYDAQKFNQDLNHFDMAAVTNTSYMMSGAWLFNNGEDAGESTNPLNWDTSSLTETMFMFRRAGDFNQPVESLDMSSVKVAAGMFASASSFNQPVNGWNTAAVTNMSWVFLGAELFDQPLDNWITTNCLDMRGMFAAAYAFNQTLSSWDTSNVQSFAGMFAAAVVR